VAAAVGPIGDKPFRGERREFCRPGKTRRNWRPWSFDGDGDLFRLVSEAKRIDLAYLFDPYLAVSTALVEPLPHQITAVYEEMLPRQPLRFLLADDPGSGRTIMTGLLMRELLVRGSLDRCLVITPGSLVDQWQMELVDNPPWLARSATSQSCVGAHGPPS
jgi:SNF2 family DNA or RNA helicase